jgi:tetratricopeptide (TPR) repeat protein
MMLPSHPSKSRADLEADLALARQNSDFVTEAACLMALGDIAKESEEYNLAQGLYGQAWAAYEKAGDQSKTVQAILALTDVYARLAWDEENFEAAFLARCFCDEAFKVAEQAQDYAGQGRAWKVKADLMGHVFEEQAIKQSTYEHALKLCEQGEDLEGQADVLMELGFIYRHDHDDNTQAKALFSHAIHLYHQAHLYEQEARSLSRLADLVTPQHDMVAKRNYYKQALKLYEQLNQPLKIAEMLGELGRLASDEKDYDLALAYHKQELALYDRYSEDANGYEGALFHIGHVYEAAKNYEEAHFYYRKQLALCDEKDTFIFADRLYALGHVYALMGNISTGRQYAMQAIMVGDNNPHNDDLFNRILMRWQWGKLEYEAGCHETACALCCEAYVLAEEIPFGSHILDVWQQDLAAMNCPPPNTEASQ